MTIHPVILAGGCGTRLWPVSRESCPKQFIELIDGTSPFQATLARLPANAAVQPSIVVTNGEHRYLVLDQVRAAKRAMGRVYLEPCGRSTAPALAVVAYDLARDDPDALMLALPADHHIPDAEAFAAAVAQGTRAAAL